MLAIRWSVRRLAVGSKSVDHAAASTTRTIFGEFVFWFFGFP